MTNAQRIAHLNEQIHNTRKLAWNASQMRAPGLGRLLDELDRLVAERRKLEVIR